MKKSLKLIILFSVGIILVSCGGGDTAPVQKTSKITPNRMNGKIFYQSECGGCHSAGTEDESFAFGSSNLAQKQDLIESNLTRYGVTQLPDVKNLMGQYQSLSKQRVADLKVYLETL